MQCLGKLFPVGRFKDCEVNGYEYFKEMRASKSCCFYAKKIGNSFIISLNLNKIKKNDFTEPPAPNVSALSNSFNSTWIYC
jgi:hypothetical protein